jgi:type II secretory pathway component GspD/PulD (secretin)
VLALAVDEGVAKELGLSDEVRKQLDDLIDKRENEVLDLNLKELPDDEQKAKLAAFAADSEKQGLALLSKEQQTKLMQIRIARGGLSTLADATVAEAIGLDEKQRSVITKMLDSLKGKLAAGTEDERRIAKIEAERGLGLILTKEQRASWEKLAGLAAGGEEKPAEVVAAKPGDDEEKLEAGDEKPEPAKPEATRPGARRPDDRKPDDKKPGVKPELSKPQPPKNIEDVRLAFNFSYTPCKDVLEWLAKEADLSLNADIMPPGTINYKDNRKYTVPQAIDLINSILLRRGYMLMRKDRMLFVIDVEDGIPPGLVDTITPEELDARGEHEVVGYLFTFKKASPEDVEADVRKIVGPQSSLVVLAKSKQMYVQEMAGKVRTIRKIIEALEGKDGGEQIETITLKYVTTDEVMGPARQLMAIPEGLFATPDGGLRIATRTNGFMVKGKQEHVDSFTKLVEQIDVKPEGEEPLPPEKAQIIVYPVTTADPDSALLVLQSVMAGQANVRIAKDPKTGSIVAHATPTQHATIKALLDEMQQDKRSFSVIRLKKLDPELVVADLKSLLGIVEGQTNTSQPKLIANTTMNYIGVFGSKQQIEQIRAAVIEMGETPAGSNDSSTTVRSYTREFHLTGRTLNAALDQLEALAPVYLPTNEIRVVKSPAVTDGVGEIPQRVPVPKEWDKKPAKPATNTNSSSQPRSEEGEGGYRGFGRGDYRGFRGFGGGDYRGGGDFRGGSERGGSERGGEGERSRGDEDRRSQRRKQSEYYYVAWQDPKAAQQETDETQPNKSNPRGAETPATEEPQEQPGTEAAKPAEAAPKQKTTPGAEVVITVTPNGIVVSSQDLDALDRVEEMLRGLEETEPGKEYTIFYLRYAKADVAADLLSQALGGGSGDEGGGGSLLGDMAGSMFGGGGGMGGLMGAMLGGGGSGSSAISSGPVLLIPDNRLNAIVAQGKPGDLDIAEMLLKIIDQPGGPQNPSVIPRPRFIPVLHTTAAEMAETIKQVYATRMTAPAGQPQQVSPQQLMQALAGGRGGRGGRGGGGGNDRKSEEPKMTIGVDEKSNSLIVSAPPALFDEIAQLVEELDIASSQKDEFVWIGNSATNAAHIEQALSSILGDDVEITRVGTTTTPARNTQRNTNASRTANNQNRNQRQPNAQPQFNPQNFTQGIPGAFPGAGGGGNRGGGGGGGNRGGGGGGNRGR